MPDIRRLTFVATSSILLFGTIYSVAYNTYLDTSNPHISSLKHHLHDVSYFARKSNILNTLFIKRAWGWTSLIWALLFASSPPSTRSTRRVWKWFAVTLVWMAFTSWFFGPAIIERLTIVSGGECVVRFPAGGVHTVPIEYCYERTLISPETHPELFITPFLLPGEDWRAKPRIMRGHDVSGHIFLLTLSLLFLADELRTSLQARTVARSPFHSIAVVATGALMGIWLFSVYTTSLYFHTPFEKLTGFCKFSKNQVVCFILTLSRPVIGLAGFLITQLPPFQESVSEVRDPERAHQD